MLKRNKKNTVNTLLYSSVHEYQSVKRNTSTEAKDELIENLLKLAVDHDLYDCAEPISELNENYINRWVDTQQEKNKCVSFIDQYNAILASIFPKAVGKTEPSEIVLVAELGKNPNVSEVKAAKDSKESALEIWIICRCNKYTVLETASDIISNYIAKNQKDVNFVVIDKDQLTEKQLPEFIISL